MGEEALTGTGVDTAPRRLGPVLAIAPAVVVGLAVVATKSAPIAVAWCVASRLAYVGYVAAALRRRTASDGRSPDAEAAWLAFRARASRLMENDAIALGALCIVTRGTLDLVFPPWATIALGLAFMAVGIGIKAWASASLPAGSFHWRSFFVTEDVVRVSATGPYRWIANPMYTLGYAHAYGFALVLGSLWGLLASAFAQAMILLLAAFVERPQLKRLRERANGTTSDP